MSDIEKFPKVFVIINRPAWDIDSVLGVCATRESAEAFKKEQCPGPAGYYKSNVELEEWALFP